MTSRRLFSANVAPAAICSRCDLRPPSAPDQLSKMRSGLGITLVDRVNVELRRDRWRGVPQSITVLMFFPASRSAVAAAWRQPWQGCAFEILARRRTSLTGKVTFNGRIDKHAVAQILRHEVAETAHAFSDAFMIGREEFSQVFRIHASRECGRTNEVREHHRDLPALGSVWRPWCGR
jgi:hypothetical protein